MRRPHTAAVLLIVIGTAASLILAEGILRISGFSCRTFPTVQFGWPEPKAIQEFYVPDRDLYWVPRDYSQRLDAARKTGAAVIFMGDSCTERSTWPADTLALLATRRPALSHGVNLGVSGWSTEQGMAQLRRDVIPLHPAVITIYFGWNDHWVALGAPDDEARPGPLWFWLSQHTRLGQLLTKAHLALTMKSLADRPNRVSLPRYRENLQTMVRLAIQNGIRPVLITAPSNHVPGAEPEYLRARHLRNLGELVPLHQGYVDETRRVAASEGATLCDAAAALESIPECRDFCFWEDGIHLSETGAFRMRDIVADCIDRALPAPG